MPARSNSRACDPSSARRGSTLVVVIGLTSLLMCLIMAITFRVRSAIDNVWNFQRSIQAHLMLQSAKLLIQGKQNDGSLAAGAAITAGDQLDLPAKGKLLASRLGWMHLKPNLSAPTTSFDVIASGGPGGDGGLKSGGGTISAGNNLQNSFETRFHYAIDYNPAASAPMPKFVIRQLDVLPNTLYPW